MRKTYFQKITIALLRVLKCVVVVCYYFITAQYKKIVSKY